LTVSLPSSPSGDHTNFADLLAGRYRLGPELARGGMGVIHAARDEVLHRDVAVKLLQSRFSPDSTTAKRFVEEACIAGQLQHPGIAPVHDLGTLPDGRPYLAMKLIKGKTLSELLKDATLSADDKISIFGEICQTVAYAHSKGVLHRDLKPANVMVGAFGEVQVMDWGLVKLLRNVEFGLQSENQDQKAEASDATSVIETEWTPDSAWPRSRSIIFYATSTSAPSASAFRSKGCPAKNGCGGLNFGSTFDDSKLKRRDDQRPLNPILNSDTPVGIGGRFRKSEETTIPQHQSPQQHPATRRF
jgi:serine/threonine protein kinase